MLEPEAFYLASLRGRLFLGRYKPTQRAVERAFVTNVNAVHQSAASRMIAKPELTPKNTNAPISNGAFVAETIRPKRGLPYFSSGTIDSTIRRTPDVVYSTFALSLSVPSTATETDESP